MESLPARAHLAPALTDARIADWCLANLGSTPRQRLFERHHLSRVIGLALVDGRRIVVKVRPDHPRLDGCYQVQRHLAATGFPCPRPLTPPVRVGALAVSAETYVAGGRIIRFSDARPELFARALARLISSTEGLAESVDVSPSPPWVSFESGSSRLWPQPDDVEGDLNDPRLSGWIDDVARKARERIARHSGRRVYGHGDWYAANIPCRGDRIHTVHDWDSVVREPECVIAGVASAIFPGTGAPGEVASVAQSDAFLRAYADERGVKRSTDDMQICWAASVWTRAFDAKKEMLRGGDILALDRQEATERLRRAGVRF
ncbi:phosphotransferase [Mycobacterium sp. M1]|uniref:Phosphotransferase n=1 Tax=Mycolicibacter acidiphilus TaxID=2835306 RepID=A0ABS5RJ09_9MYCO|nr:phosphotransferase [Mycolicibacter acidiphilus]MBS9534287.1 phosphotransferase [Mycolicibacter acidiphilus]